MKEFQIASDFAEEEKVTSHLDLTHEEVTRDDSLPGFTIQEVPIASSPKVIFTNAAKQYKDKINVDAELIKNELLTTGFEENIASSFAIVFHHKAETIERKSRQGWYNSFGFIEHMEDDALLHYPLAVHINLPQKRSNIKNTLWHEFGHAYQDKVMLNSNEPLHQDRNMQRRVQKIGLGAAFSGLVMQGVPLYLDSVVHGNNVIVGLAGTGVATTLAGLGIFALNKSILYTVDKGELHAIKFAYHRRHLQPINTSEKAN